MNRRFSHTAGFTLIELLISVVLMVMLVGIVVMVFSHASEVMSTSEAKMEVYQNARAAFELMARDLSGVQVSASQQLSMKTPVETATITEYFLNFTTIASWREGGTAHSGTANIRYRLAPVGATGLVNLERRLTPMTGGVAGTAQPNLLAQYVHNTGQLRFNIEFYNPTSNAFERPDATGSNSCFDNTTTARRVPPAIRVSMDLRDRRGKVVRTFSRVIWIATGGN